MVAEYVDNISTKFTEMKDTMVINNRKQLIGGYVFSERLQDMDMVVKYNRQD